MQAALLGPAEQAESERAGERDDADDGLGPGGGGVGAGVQVEVGWGGLGGECVEGMGRGT